MFTGIIENTLKVIKTEKKDTHLNIICELPYKDITLGESISINGACLTVAKFDLDSKPKQMEFFVSSETLKLTNLSSVKAGTLLNSERALKLSDRLSGHIVSGHIDAIGILTNKVALGESSILKFKIPQTLRKYCIKKGSICISGISLTINEITQENPSSDYFTVELQIIPHTWTHTNLHTLEVNDQVNIEVDLLGKYIENMILPAHS